MTETKCGNCGFECDEDSLNPIKNLSVRIDAGSEVPAGQCPECGALSYLSGKSESEGDRALRVVEAIRREISTTRGEFSKSASAAWLVVLLKDNDFKPTTGPARK